MPQKVAKSYAISDAKIMFVSLVDKAANKHKFLITKSEGDKADFQTFGRIVKTDVEKHYVTGIVYEPMVEDTDGNYMTEDEITKAAHWFMKNAGDADIQHCFEKAENVEVVESYVAKCDMEIEGQQIKKGTWLMTMEVTDDDVWSAIEKGEITGFSMGGKGNYSETDVDISDPENPVEKAGEKKGILKALASMFGMDVVEKGAVKDSYKRRIVRDNFWAAFYTLSDALLETYNPSTGRYENVTDETTIRDALSDFNEIITELLTGGDSVFKSIEKAGKKMSAENKETLKGIYEGLGMFLSKFDEVEVEDMKKEDVEKMVADAVAKAMSANGVNGGSGAAGNVTKGVNAGNGARGGNESTDDITPDDIAKMVNDAIAKAMKPKEDEQITRDSIQKMIDDSIRKACEEDEEPEDNSDDMGDAITKAVQAAMEPFMKQAGIPTNLNDSNVQKSGEEQHYMHGII